ncbi:AraC family transcriptional regulator [Microvirga yunnanensis]|uniref:AraC family transcriptional regulator n=1 Tax=Microvirga yunnanensis TaxID=2953740 RepID=UPI0021C9B23D|nr:AraC family transcriptional regulator [Microvirga sp. HBU65207]
MLQTLAKPMSFRFSTAEIPACDRRDAILRLRERGVLPIEPLPDALPSLQITKFAVPGMGVLSGRLNGLRQEGRPPGIGYNDDLFLGVNLSGCSVAFQKEREMVLRQGDAILLGCAEGRFAIVRPTPAQFLGVRVPRTAIAPLVNGLDDRVGELIRKGAGAVRLLTAYLNALGTIEVENSPQMCHAVVNHMYDLIGLSVEADREAAVRADSSVRAARLQAIKAEVMASLGDASLSLIGVAARQGVTTRYVHKLFESEGTTFSQFVLRHRLERAYRMLSDARLVRRSITSIAYDAGFGDLSYFNRAFRRLYNVTPSDIRNRRDLR